MITLIVLLLLLPFALLYELFRIGRSVAQPLRRWRAVPLAQKNTSRATFGAFVVALSIGLAVAGCPIVGWRVTAGIGGLGLLYLVVGVSGSQGARFDVMSLFWWGVAAAAFLAVLLHFKGMV